MSGFLFSHNVRVRVCGVTRSNSSSREVIFRSESDVIRRKFSVCVCEREIEMAKRERKNTISERKWLVKHAYVYGSWSFFNGGLFFSCCFYCVLCVFWGLRISFFFLQEKKMNYNINISVSFFFFFWKHF